MVFLLYFFSLLTRYPFIISYSSIPSFKSPTAPLHLPRSSPYKVHSHNTCFSVSTSPHRHLSSSYFHVILSLPSHWQTSPLTISLTPAPTFPICKTFISWTLFHLYILFLPFCIIKAIFPYLFANLPYSSYRCASSRIPHFTFIPNFTIPFKLTFPNQIRFTNSKNPYYICA